MLRNNYDTDSYIDNQNPHARWNYLAVHWNDLRVVTLGSCVNQTQANKRAAKRGHANAHPQHIWLAAAGDKDALMQAGAESVALSLIHPQTGDLYFPQLDADGKVFLKRWEG